MLIWKFIEQNLDDPRLGPTRWVQGVEQAGSSIAEIDYKRAQDIRLIIITQLFVQFTGTGEAVALNDNVANLTICTFDNTTSGIGFYQLQHLVMSDHIKMTLTTVNMNWAVQYMLVYAKSKLKS